MVELTWKEQLEKSYRNTTYAIFIDGKHHNVRIGQSIPDEIQQRLNILGDKTAAIITAWNPKSQELSLNENKSRNIELKTKLKNYIIYDAIGQGDDFEWAAEESYFILGIGKDDLEVFSIDYEQFSYVWLESDKLTSLMFTKLWED